MIYNKVYVEPNHFFSPQKSWYTPEKTTFFHCISTGHYWRNSLIMELSLLYENPDEKWIRECWRLESEKDEYDILDAFSCALTRFDSLIGFNSSSYHIPYLEQKLKAYGMSSPFIGKYHTDLLKVIKPTGAHLHISTKLNDLRIFLNLPDSFSEIECIASATALFRYEKILMGAFSVKKTELLEGELLFFCKTEHPFPTAVRIHDEEFYLIGLENDLKIKVKLFQDRLKLYYSNYKDYYYLPDEDMVVHKSLAASIHKDKKLKATAENCFTYIEYSEYLLNNPAASKKYLTALLQHYMNTQ